MKVLVAVEVMAVAVVVVVVVVVIMISDQKGMEEEEDLQVSQIDMTAEEVVQEDFIRAVAHSEEEEEVVEEVVEEDIEEGEENEYLDDFVSFGGI